MRSGPRVPVRIKDTGLPSASVAVPLISTDEARQLGILRKSLPEAWVLEVKAAADMAWVAFVFCAQCPRSRPMFTLCRWSDRVGLFVQWMDGTASSVAAFRDLEPILELIPSDIFASTKKQLATVPAEGWTSTRH